jgi:hypothetical protein
MQLIGSNIVVASIASGGTTSDMVNLMNRRLLAIQLPAAFTGTALTFQASYDGITFATLYIDGADVSLTVAQGKYVAVDPATFAGVEILKVISGSAEGAARSIVLICGEVLG